MNSDKPMYIGFDDPASNMRMLRTSCAVTNASKNKPLVTLIDASSFVSIVRAPGKRPETKPAAAIAAIICAMMVWSARCQCIFRVSHKAAVTYG